MSKIKCVLLDDELPGLTYLRMLCEQFPYVEIVKCFDSSQQFVSEVQNVDFDICLLDINMPGINGLEIAERLKNKYIIFVSAYPEFAVDAFELEAIDFIKKTVVKDRLEKALARAYKLLTEKPAERIFFTWNTSLGKSIIFVDEIIFISTSDVDKRDKIISLKDGSGILLKNITLEKLLMLLPLSSFMQINKAEIISKHYVHAHSANDITLRSQNSKKPIAVSLGESYRKLFLAWIS